MKILSVVGARPQFVKAAMLCIAIQRHTRDQTGKGIRHVLVHTGQHYDHNLSDIFFEQLPLPEPEYWLAVGSGKHGAQTAAMLERVESVLLKQSPDVVVVYGDTNSAIAGALAASKLQIPVAHIEAGLRSFNRLMPEEVNRIATDHISDLLFCPTRTAVRNLKNEGISRGVHLTGDVMLDAVQEFRALAQRRSLLTELGIGSKQYALVTIHRAENTDSREQLEFIVAVLTRVGLPIVFPMHPRLRNRLAQCASYRALGRKLKSVRNLHIIAPVSYLDMLLLEENARLVLTDSGGVQKEAYFLSVPCVTLRDETEWLETLRGGWNRLSARSASKTLATVRSLWSGNGLRPKGRPDLAVFGGGNAAENTLAVLLDNFGRKRYPKKNDAAAQDLSGQRGSRS
jgi:UDP-GlcNAc3NAcA epimerase